MKIVPLSMKEAEGFLGKHERHYKSPAEAVCAIGLVDGEELHGAVILGRNTEGEAELTHIYCDGVSQGYTLLYGACWRAFKAMGYRTAVL